MTRMTRCDDAELSGPENPPKKQTKLFDIAN